LKRLLKTDYKNYILLKSLSFNWFSSFMLTSCDKRNRHLPSTVVPVTQAKMIPDWLKKSVKQIWLHTTDCLWSF